MRESYDVAIAGAGIVGAACAAECAAAGLKVVIVEPGPIGGGATAAGMGHIVVMDDSPAQIALTHYSRTLWQEMAPDLPFDVEYVATGTIWVAADEEEMEEVSRKQAVYAGINVRAEVLDRKALAEAEPNLRANLAGGLLVPDDAVIYPPCGARFLLDRARLLGAEVRTGEGAAQLTEEGIQLRDGSRLPAAITVNATGAWAPELTPGIEVRKRKGHLVITDRYPNFVRHQLVELGYLKSAHSTTADSVAFNAQPRRTGQILIGSSRQFGAEHSATDPPILGRMLARAAEYMPGLPELSAIRCWTGFRAATPDKLPLIGPCPEQPRLCLATGHEGLGITTSLGTAKLLAAQLTGKPCAIPIEPYLPSRKQNETHEAHPSPGPRPPIPGPQEIRHG
ncbi:MAG TPA: FAD-dependent oxidoreductase [Bryobacteraceae bacterium]|nr:FAD-dependent oxidoreductase [Bryobacteraceae bacterium]